MTTEANTLIRDYSQGDYREFWTGPSQALLDATERAIIAKTIPSRSGWFIDIGCGYGRLASAYLHAAQRIVLLDYAVNLLEMAAASYPQENIHFIAADAYHLPFREGVFAGGLCVRLFHHANAPSLFLREVARVLSPRALLLLNYSNKRNFFRVIKYGKGCFKRDHEEIKKMLFSTHPAFFARICRENGLEIKALRGTGFFDQLTHVTGAANLLLGRIPPLLPPIRLLEGMLDALGGRIGWAPLQYALLARSDGAPPPRPGDTPDALLRDILACPACHQAGLQERPGGLACAGCGRFFPRRGKIWDFRCDASKLRV